jgi:hypothetical protein
VAHRLPLPQRRCAYEGHAAGGASRLSRRSWNSAFAAILETLVGRVRRAQGAALVDADGETVDFVGQQEPFLAKLIAAHIRITLEAARGQRSLAATWLMVVRDARASFVVRGLPHGYALVVWLARGAWLGSGTRGIEDCARRLSKEAGWPWVGRTDWYAVEVQTAVDGRPDALRAGDRLEPLEILGRYASGLTRGERGWRVRLQAGVETTLIREPGGFWYTDAPFD